MSAREHVGLLAALVKLFTPALEAGRAPKRSHEQRHAARQWRERRRTIWQRADGSRAVHRKRRAQGGGRS